MASLFVRVAFILAAMLQTVWGQITAGKELLTLGQCKFALRHTQRSGALPYKHVRLNHYLQQVWVISHRVWQDRAGRVALHERMLLCTQRVVDSLSRCVNQCPFLLVLPR